MMIRTNTILPSAMVLALTTIIAACSTVSAPQSGTGGERKPERTKEQMIDLGRQHKTAADLYRALREQANGGQRLTMNDLPDWSGVYTRMPVPGFAFDPEQPANGLPTAKLTPAFQAKLLKRLEDA